jgi:hypothetical protein
MPTSCNLPTDCEFNSLKLVRVMSFAFVGVCLSTGENTDVTLQVVNALLRYKIMRTAKQYDLGVVAGLSWGGE